MLCGFEALFKASWRQNYNFNSSVRILINSINRLCTKACIFYVCEHQRFITSSGTEQTEKTFLANGSEKAIDKNGLYVKKVYKSREQIKLSCVFIYKQ